MYGILVCEDRHRRSYTDTVIGTQRCAIGSYPLAVVLYIGLDRVFLKIEVLVAVLLRHHIHVSLQDHTRMVLVARRSRFANEDVTDLVVKGLQTETFTVVHEEFRDLFAFTARTRDLGKAVEAAPQAFRL